MKIDADALVRKLGAMVGTVPNMPIRFQLDSDFSHPVVQGLRKVIWFLAEQISSKPDNMPVVAVAEMEQFLMICFLTGNRHNYSHLLNGRIWSLAPWQVRRAEEYTEANWDEPITVEALASAGARPEEVLAQNTGLVAGPTICFNCRWFTAIVRSFCADACSVRACPNFGHEIC